MAGDAMTGGATVARSASTSSSAFEVEMAPKTPFCIVTIFSAAAWLPASVAAQQSPRMRHS